MVGEKTLRIASRGSALALWQARFVETRLIQLDPSLDIEIEVVRTTGDRILDVPLAQIGAQGLFTKELDASLLAGEADIAVHSLKDVPTRLPEGLVVAAILSREDPRDVLIGKQGVAVSTLDIAPGSRVGTSSLRRRAQLLAGRPDLEVADLRGNLNTRVARLDAGDYDAIILAAAGIVRLGWQDRIGEFLSPPDWLPAVGQGALAIVARTNADSVLDRVQRLHDPETAAATTAERAFLRTVQGGCQIPVAALAATSPHGLRLSALISSLDGRQVVRATDERPKAAAEELGELLAIDLLARGGEEILTEVRRNAVPAPPFIGP